MRVLKILGIFVGLASLVSVVAYGATIRVPDDYATIQEAIDAAISSDIILVEPGVYVGGIDFGGKNLLIQSTTGPEATTIDGNGGKGVLIGPQGALIGFSITNSIAVFGAGMEVIGTGTIISSNIFDGNIQTSGGYGAAIGGNNASPTIENNVFRNNTCDNQWIAGVISFVNSSSPRIINNIIENNPCRAINMHLPSWNQPEVINNTIVNNRTGVRVDRRNTQSSQIYRNNIIVGNEIGLEIDLGIEAYNPTWENNLVFDNLIDYDGILDQTGLNGNISEDPLFVDPANKDFHLTKDSPCIDAGTSEKAPDIDIDGDSRPQGADYDIGADEYVDCSDFAGNWSGTWSETNCDGLDSSGTWTSQVYSDCSVIGTPDGLTVTGTIDPSTGIFTGSGTSEVCGSITLDGDFIDDSVTGSYSYSSGGGGSFIGSFQSTFDGGDSGGDGGGDGGGGGGGGG